MYQAIGNMYTGKLRLARLCPDGYGTPDYSRFYTIPATLRDAFGSSG